LEDNYKSVKKIRKPDPVMRIKAIDFIQGLYCINCPFKSECSSRYPNYLYKCKYLEEWVIEKYKKHLEGERE